MGEDFKSLPGAAERSVVQQSVVTENQNSSGSEQQFSLRNQVTKNNGAMEQQSKQATRSSEQRIQDKRERIVVQRGEVK